MWQRAGKNWKIVSRVTDMLEKFWADTIGGMALRQAVRCLNQILLEGFQPGELSRMNPGSLPDWPSPNRGPFFKILGHGPRDVGVHLRPLS